MLKLILHLIQPTSVPAFTRNLFLSLSLKGKENIGLGFPTPSKNNKKKIMRGIYCNGTSLHQSRVFYELCRLLFTILHYPQHLSDSSSALGMVGPPFNQRRRQRDENVTPAALAALLLGASTALMLCGRVTLLIGFMLMPWVIGLVMLLYFAGIISIISRCSRAVFCQDSAASEHSSTPRRRSQVNSLQNTK